MDMGERVAENRAPHIQLEVHRLPTGELYIVHKPIHYPVPMRKEYVPVGLTLKYPKKWDKWKAEELVLEKRMEDLQRVIQNAEEELRELQPLWDKVQKDKGDAI